MMATEWGDCQDVVKGTLLPQKKPLNVAFAGCFHHAAGNRHVQACSGTGCDIASRGVLLGQHLVANHQVNCRTLTGNG
jgi:hypothetical protein